MSARWTAIAGSAAWIAGGALLLAGTAFAEIVPIGRHVELRASQHHAYATYRGDARRTGRSRARAPAKEPSRVWSVVSSQRRLVPPAVLADGTLLIGGSLGLEARDAKTGDQRWLAEVGAVRFTPTLTPAGDAIVAAAGRLLRIDTRGAAHAIALPFAVSAANLRLESEELVVTGERRLHVLTADGMHLRSTPQLATRWTALVVADLIVAAGGTALTVLSPQDGTARTLELPESLEQSPLVGDDGVIWALGDSGSVFHIAPGGEMSRIAGLGNGGFAGAPALGWDGALRVGLGHGEVACVDGSGKELWRRGIDSWPGPLLIDADDTTLALSARGTLYAIDRRGELRWRKHLGEQGKVVLGPDGTVFLALRGGAIQSWR